MTDIRCIGICTGGGDAPGLNAVIRATVKCAILKYKWKVIRIPAGFDGLIDGADGQGHRDFLRRLTAWSILNQSAH